MSATQEATGTLDVALKHTAQLLKSAPALAIEQANEILEAVPQHPAATMMLGVAQRATGAIAASRQTLDSVVTIHPAWPLAHLELARTLALAHEGELAIAQLRRAVELKPDLPDAWRELGDHLTAHGNAGATQRPANIFTGAAVSVNTAGPKWEGSPIRVRRQRAAPVVRR